MSSEKILGKIKKKNSNRWRNGEKEIWF